MFTSRIAKISKLKKKPGLTNSSSIVYCFCETLLADRRGYVVFMDNFFSNAKLFIALKKLNINVVGQAKLGSAFPVKLLEIRKLSIRRSDWRMKIYITALKDRLCLVWQDLGSTQIMTAVHSIEDIETSEFISSQKQRGILSNSVISLRHLTAIQLFLFFFEFANTTNI